MLEDSWLYHLWFSDFRQITTFFYCNFSENNIIDITYTWIGLFEDYMQNICKALRKEFGTEEELSKYVIILLVLL